MKKFLIRLVFLMLFIFLVVNPILIILETPLIIGGLISFLIGWNWMRICDYFQELYYRARRGE